MVHGAVGEHRFEAELGVDGASNCYVPVGPDRDVVRDGGVFVQTFRKLPAVGSLVSLSLVIPAGPIDTEAVVTFVREASLGGAQPGFGARLVNLTSVQETSLRRFLLDHDPMVLRL